MEPKPPLLTMRGITKTYPGVTALDGVDFELREGEVHALVGENGAGKSTLIKILMGIERRDGGEIRLRGEAVEFHTPHDAQRNKIAAVFQELSQVPHLTVGENVFLGREREVGGFLLRRKALYRRTAGLIEEYRMDLDPREPVSRLSMAKRQIAEIVKAVAIEPRLLILDEPTSSLTENEAENLFRIIHSFKRKGIGVIYISHRMNELARIADRVTVLRDGRKVATRPIAELSMDDIVQMMVGREMDFHRPRNRDGGAVGYDKVLEVRNLSQRGRFDGISFDLRRGEILGVAGLVGSGRSELTRLLFGIERADDGQIRIDGVETPIRNVRDAMAAGIAMIPESRQLQGLVLGHSIENNLALPSLKRFTGRFFLSGREKQAFARDMIDKYAIKTDSPRKTVRQLSGGNQQKVVIAKWLATEPRILIIDEPTVGIDIHSKTEIHRMIRDLADQGLGVIMVSSEMPELIANSDRIMVMNDFRVLAVERGLDQNRIMTLIMQDKERLTHARNA